MVQSESSLRVLEAELLLGSTQLVLKIIHGQNSWVSWVDVCHYVIMCLKKLDFPRSPEEMNMA